MSLCAYHLEVAGVGPQGVEHTSDDAQVSLNGSHSPVACFPERADGGGVG